MLEALLLDDVTIPASANFADEYKRLQTPQPPGKKSLIDKQFEVGALRKAIYKLIYRQSRKLMDHLLQCL